MIMYLFDLDADLFNFISLHCLIFLDQLYLALEILYVYITMCTYFLDVESFVNGTVPWKLNIKICTTNAILLCIVIICSDV